MGFCRHIQHKSLAQYGKGIGFCLEKGIEVSHTKDCERCSQYELDPIFERLIFGKEKEMI